MTLHVTCSTDDNYIQHCMAMLCSLFENNKDHEIVVHLLVNNLSNKSRDVISTLSGRYGNKTIFYNIEPKNLGDLQMNNAQLNGQQMYSITTYYRVLLPSLLSNEIDRLLYLDCDIIVMRDVSELFELNMENYGVAAVKDNIIYDSYHRLKIGIGMQHTTFCAGMMMINLNFWRETNSQKKLLEYIQRRWKGAYMQDQDALNYVFRDAWLQLPYKWGKMPLAVAPLDRVQKWFDIKEFVEMPCIYHYAAHVKPWLDVWFPNRKYYWKYVQLSGFPGHRKTHANRQLRITIYKSVTRFLINKYIHPFIPDFLELILIDFYYGLLFVASITRPSKYKELMLKRWCRKYRL